MIAVIETGGKQYLIKPGVSLRVEKLAVEAGKEFVFDKVLLISEEDGTAFKVGDPYLSGVTVSATVEAHGRAEKIRVVKFKRKVRYTRTRGHRQEFTKVKVKGIK